MKLIDKAALVAEINKRIMDAPIDCYGHQRVWAYNDIKDILDTLEVKEVDLMIHTIIAECCDWLAMNTNLSHDEIEGCRNLMLTVKEEQCKAQKGE